MLSADAGLSLPGAVQAFVTLLGGAVTDEDQQAANA
jgi:hypothetical protein